MRSVGKFFFKHKSRTHVTSGLLREIVIPYKCAHYLLKLETYAFTCCECSSVSNACMEYETFNSRNVNSVFTPSGSFSQRGSHSCHFQYGCS